MVMKASPDDHAAAEYVCREAAVTPHVFQLAPRLLAAYEVGGWVATLTTHHRGRFADLTPGSPDLPRVVRALSAVKRGYAGPPLPCLSDRWSGSFGRDDRRLFRGPDLLHTNLHRTNLLVTSECRSNPRVRVTGWGRAVVGPAWVEPVLFYLELRRAGHTPADALTLLARMPAWRTALPERITALARWMRSSTTAVREQEIWAELIE
ncbi:hypothetical protein ACFRCG_12905 [Embleya sp. NPDC056575]|uniref:hypothetical protein n=1 Tax=unclassified Embleya TaxID=2699296 RepID=UPI0036916442